MWYHFFCDDLLAMAIVMGLMPQYEKRDESQNEVYAKP